MDSFASLKWRWSTARSDEQNERFYEAQFSDDEMDVFHNHLYEIDHVHRLDSYNPQASRNHQKRSSNIHRDPRTGEPVTRHLIDATFAAKPQLHPEIGGRQSKIPGWQHAAGLRVLKMKYSSSNNGTVAPVTNAMKTFAETAAKRAAEGKEFTALASAYFDAHTVKRCRQMRPFLSDRIAAEWSRALSNAVCPNRSAHHAYVIQTAIPLDIASEEVVRMEVVGDAIRDGARDLPTYVKCVQRRPFPRASDSVVPLWPQLHGFPMHELMQTHDARVLISLNVIRQLIDYPANSTESWLISVEIIENIDGRKSCIFDEMLPAAVLQTKHRNRLALRRQVLGDTLQVLRSKIVVGSYNEDVLNVSLDMKYQPIAFEDFIGAFCRTNQSSAAVADPTSLCRAVVLNGNLRLLVHTNVDGIERNADDKQPSVSVHVSVKPEYQAEFGAEQMSQSELVDEWLRLIFNPDSVVDRYRVDAETGTIFSVRRLTRADIEEEMQRLHSFKPDNLLSRLYEIIRLIMNFPCQRYLLRHSHKPDRTVRVYGRVETSAPNTVNIDRIIAEEAATIPSDTFTWTAIDETCITGIHLAANVLPCMFPHRLSALPGVVPSRGNRKHRPLNDRDALVARRQSEIAVREAAKLQSEQRLKSARKAAKRRRRAERQKLLQTAASAAKMEDDANPYLSRNDDTIDPGVVFDAHGNIILQELLKP